MNPKAFVFFDLDGTLMNTASSIDTEVINAIQKLKENNIIPFIATGRSNSEIQNILQKTAISSTISLNGQCVTYEGKKVYSQFLPEEKIAAIKEAADQRQIALSFYTDDWIRVTDQNEDMARFYNFLNTEIPELDAGVYLTEKINMVSIVTADTDHDDFFFKTFSDLNIFRTTSYNLDIINAGTSKATGIEKLLSEMSFETVPTYAFGDGMNDLEMLKHVDYAIAMGNAFPELKKRADFVTSSNSEGGIIRGLKQYGLI